MSKFTQTSVRDPVTIPTTVTLTATVTPGTVIDGVFYPPTLPEAREPEVVTASETVRDGNIEQAMKLAKLYVLINAMKAAAWSAHVWGAARVEFCPEAGLDPRVLRSGGDLPVGEF